MISIFIDEEYGYRYWFAELTDVEYKELIARWGTMRGLNCLVPVTLIIPQAKAVEYGFNPPVGSVSCHIHECDDSWLDGCNYAIPEDENHLFWIDGKSYSYDML